MITNVFKRWLTRKWLPSEDKLAESYSICFTSNIHGQRVLQHLLDTIYCQVCPNTDPYEIAAHNGMRAVVQQMLVMIDQGEHPMRRDVKVITKEPEHAGGMG